MPSVRVLALGCFLALGVSAACARSGGSDEPKPQDAVATGYGEQDRDTYTGSAATLTAEDIESQRSTTIEEMLAGRVAGLEVRRLPNGELTLRIRGANSFRGNTEPLVVIDGIQVAPGSLSSALASLTPQDIASIDVLKDAASTSMYGIRGSNGVIVIRTKRGG